MGAYGMGEGDTSIDPYHMPYNTTEGEVSNTGCSYDWCPNMPGITAAQFYTSFALQCLGFPYCIALTQSLYSKIIGPRRQVITL